MTYAVDYGNFEIVQWLYSVNCPWDKYTCSSAARTGNLEMLKWLRARNCPWDHMVCIAARRHGQKDVMRWAHENGCPCLEDCKYSKKYGKKKE